MLAAPTISSAQTGRVSGAAVAQFGGGTVRNPLAPAQRLRAVLFDVDGTMYHQGRLRLLMAAELAAFAARRPLHGRRVVRALSEYRRAQETLRHDGNKSGASEQLALAATRTGLSLEEIGTIVDDWMHVRPLKYLAGCRAYGLNDLLAFLATKRVPLGVLSDYPATAKLDALRVAERFSLVLCGGDGDIGAFKPSPRGFFAACASWRLDPSDVLYVGDRVDVDAAGAAAAGMPAVIVTGSRLPKSSAALAVSSLERLRHVLDDHNSR
jgi:FMN phosphatase YigB (HAD superfamily)